VALSATSLTGIDISTKQEPLPLLQASGWSDIDPGLQAW
jgi:hypothetical protein